MIKNYGSNERPQNIYKTSNNLLQIADFVYHAIITEQYRSETRSADWESCLPMI